MISNEIERLGRPVNWIRLFPQNGERTTRVRSIRDPIRGRKCPNANRIVFSLSHSPATARYSSRIIKAGALLSDTKTLLSQWDTSSPVQANLARIRQENIFGKASRSRVEDILAIFRQRYLVDDGVIRALVALVRDRLPANALDRILYFHSASADLLLSDIVTEWLARRLSEGRTDLDTSDIQRLLVEWVAQGKTKGRMVGGDN